MKYCFHILSLLFVLPVIVLGQTNDNLVLHYAFENEEGFNAYESVSQELNAQLLLGAYFTEDALYLDGTDDELRTQKMASTVLNGTTISISAWIKPDATKSQATIISKSLAYELYIENSAVYFEVVTTGSNRMLGRTNSDVINPDELFHIAAVRSGTQIDIYIDGVKQENVIIENASGDNLYPANNDIYIGSGRASTFFNGLIHDIKMFDIALDAGDVEALFTDNDAPLDVPKIEIGANQMFQNFRGSVQLYAKASQKFGELGNGEWQQIAGAVTQIIGNQVEISEFGKYVYEYQVAQGNSKSLTIWNFDLSRNIIYVSPTASGEGNGTRDQPFSEIQKAIEGADNEPNSIIFLDSGVYTVNDKIELPPRTSLIGAGQASSKLVAGQPLWTKPSRSPQNAIILSDGNSLVKIGHFTIDGVDKKATIGMSVFNSSYIEIDNINIINTYFSGLVLTDIKSSVIHELYLENTSWGNDDYSTGAIAFGDLTEVDFHDIYISEGIINKPDNWGYGIKGYQINGSTKLEKVRIYNSKIETTTPGIWNNGLAPNIAIEFHSTSFVDCEIFNVETNQTISLVPNKIIDGTKNMRLHHNKIIGSGGTAIESYMQNCEIDHNYIIGEYYTIDSFNDDTFEDYLVHHNVFTDQFPKKGASEAMSYGVLKSVQFYNNTIYNTIFNYLPVIELTGNSPSTNIEVVNNIFYSKSSGGAKVFQIESGASVEDLTFKNNVMYNYTLGTTADVNSGNSTADPQLELINTPSYWLPVPASDSWVIDAGTDVGLPYSGDAPDIGAGEGTIGLAQGPAITSVFPSANTPISVGEPITISATANDPDGTIAKMEIYVSGALVETVEETDQISYEFTASEFGVYAIIVKAYDNDGMQVSSRTELYGLEVILSARDENLENLEREISIYPNPVINNQINIHSQSFANGKIYSVQVRDVTGRLIEQKFLTANNNAIVYPFSSSTSGIVYVQVKMESKYLTSRALVNQ